MLTPQETDVLRQFLDDLIQIRSVDKDPQAYQLITDALAKQPNAGYLLVQRALLQDQALANAQAQIAQLQAERANVDPARNTENFFDPANSWGHSAGRSSEAAGSPASENWPQQVPAAPMRSSFYGNGAGTSGFGGGSFLGSMAATAAGVAGGAFLYQGIQNLMGHHGAGLQGREPGTQAESSSHQLADDSLSSSMAQSATQLSDVDASSEMLNNDDLGSSDDMASI